MIPPDAVEALERFRKGEKQNYFALGDLLNELDEELGPRHRTARYQAIAHYLGYTSRYLLIIARVARLFPQGVREQYDLPFSLLRLASSSKSPTKWADYFQEYYNKHGTHISFTTALRLVAEFSPDEVLNARPDRVARAMKRRALALLRAPFWKPWATPEERKRIEDGLRALIEAAKRVEIEAEVISAIRESENSSTDRAAAGHEGAAADERHSEYTGGPKVDG